ncbi:MAG: porin family protein [Hyphomicrobiales bacterium]|nr:porin family protein [Hyphomicrobiales bacterium]MBV8664436.1 porin family protein [Hyphomicrobiales bacterium]
MKKGLFLAATTLLLTGSALAADLPTTKAPPPVAPPPPPYNWTGFYAGLNAGAGFWDSGHVTILDPVAGLETFRVDSNTSFVGGGQAGVNWQIGQTVFGLEADFQGVAGSSSFNWRRFNPIFGPGGTVTPGYLGTARGRLGYALDRTLIYATGGFAYGQLFNGPFNNNAQTGYTVGGGVEYAFLSNWTMRVEALYVNLGEGSITKTLYNAGVAYPVTSSGANDGVVVRVGANYKF